MMNPSLRKFALTVHITCSVGWIGAVMAFLALVIAAMTSQDIQMLRAVWMALGMLISLVIVPLALASLLTGIVMSLGTKWGLFQHYWVLFSFALTVFSILILLGNVQTVNFFTGIATELDSHDVELLRDGLRSELLHAGVGLLVLVIIQGLNVYKPRGLTSYGWRKQQKQRTVRQSISTEM
jgi:hypothetical protein